MSLCVARKEEKWRAAVTGYRSEQHHVVSLPLECRSDALRRSTSLISLGGPGSIQVDSRVSWLRLFWGALLAG